MRALSIPAAFILLITCTGCGGSSLTPVSGKVLLDGKPLQGATGSLQFVPSAGGPTGMANLKADGSYQAKTGTVDGLKPGDYDIAVFADEPVKADLGTKEVVGKSLIAAKYSDARQSGLKLKVEGSAKTHDITVSK